MNEANKPILIVDDEPQIRKLLTVTLQAHQYATEEAATGEEGLQLASSVCPDLIILDLGLPDMTGMEVLNRIRSWSDVPIIVLTAKDREEDKIAALDNGADDYVTKPFAMGELVARIRVALRHAQQSVTDPILRIGELVLDLEQRIVEMKGERMKLTPTEYDLLRILAINAGKVVTQRQLLKQVWGDNHNPSDNHYIRVYIGHLRKKLEEDTTQPKWIITEPGIGYRLLDSHRFS
ncbi:response regulator transcription factor [Paenibacillus oenotherae]|uniref:Response regulator transcription factor n=1 Tax=Paenibacillus oenotherae TaxID=1435645 RepID=A0ABS7D5S0_9BACL|nr:response regulator transcription factor [Paenibacillus oenotherae]MBW7475255.1 response regulator transcription factor [Paenibacillus oenotherae]